MEQQATLTVHPLFVDQSPRLSFHKLLGSMCHTFIRHIFSFFFSWVPFRCFSFCLTFWAQVWSQVTSYPLRDTNGGRAVGGEVLRFSGFGFETSSRNGVAQGYECVFASGTWFVATSPATVDSSTTSTNTSCLTAAWGGDFTSQNTNLTLWYNGSVVPRVSSPSSMTDFEFRPSFESTDGTELNGAAGGDTIRFTASGLNFATDTYTCLYSSVAEVWVGSVAPERRFANLTTTARDVTLTSAVCDVPAWGELFQGSVLHVDLISGLTGLPVLPPRGDRVSFNADEVLHAVVRYPDPANRGGSADGDETLVVRAFGLDVTAGDAEYFAVFTVALYGVSCNMSAPCSAPINLTTMQCTTPSNWGSTCPAGGGTLVLRRNGIELLTTSGREGVEFTFVGSVKGQDITAGSSTGGSTILFTGSGFDTMGQYRCRFSSGQDVLFSSVAQASTPTSLSCVTPRWGFFFPASVTNLTLEYDTNYTATSTVTTDTPTPLPTMAPSLAPTAPTTLPSSSPSPLPSLAPSFTTGTAPAATHTGMPSFLPSSVSSSLGVPPSSSSSWRGSLATAMPRQRRLLATTSKDTHAVWGQVPSTEALSFSFSAQVLDFRVDQDTGAKGGSIMNFTIPGLRNSTTSYSCSFNSTEFDAAMVTKDAKATSVSTLICRCVNPFAACPLA